MIRSLWSAASGMHAYQSGIDVISNNMANINTVGYKQVDVTFSDLIYQQSASTPNYSGNPINLGSGTRMAATTRQFTQGVLEQTSRELDVAIQGNGFMPFRRPDGQVVYARDGALKIDANGYLTSSNGYLLEPNIAVPQNAKNVQIQKNGIVQALMPDNTTRQIGRIYLANFANPAGLENIGDNFFAASENSGAVTVQAAGENGAGYTNQGFLERSNVDMAQQMVNLITGQRAYELSSRAIRVADDMMDLANRLRR